MWERFEQEAARLTGLRERLARHLADCEGFFLNGAGAPRLPNTLNLGFEGISAESLVVTLDLAGVAISTGSACQSGAVEPSHVLRAMGLPEPRVRGAVRVSLGHDTTEAAVDRCAETMLAEVARMRRVAAKRAG